MMIRKFKFFDGIIDNTYVVSTTPYCDFVVMWNEGVVDYYRNQTVTNNRPMLWYSSSSLSIDEDLIENLINRV